MLTELHNHGKHLEVLTDEEYYPGMNKCRGMFRPLLNIYDGALCENRQCLFLAKVNGVLSK